MNKSRLLSLILALIFLITAIPMNFSLAQTYPAEGVTIEFIYFRQSPKAEVKPQVVGCETIAKGEKVTVVCESDGFYLLKYKGFYGFAPMKSVHIGELPTPVPTKAPTIKPAKTTTPTQKPAAGLTLYTAIYSGGTKENIYFRKYPTKASKPRVAGCETIAAGEEVYVIGADNGCYYIKYNNYFGYVLQEEIRVYGVAETQPSIILPAEDGTIANPTPTKKATPAPTKAPTVKPAKTTTSTNKPSMGGLTVYAAVYSGAARENIYFRKYPTKASKPRVVGCETIAKGKELYVIGADNGCYYIKYNNYFGYALQEEIRVYGVAETQPSVIFPAEDGTIANPTPTKKATPAPTSKPPLTGENSGVSMYSEQYIGKTKELVYFRQKPTSATKPRVSGCESIASGKQVTVLGESGNFYYITYKGYYGYARKQDIKITGKAAAPTPTPTPAQLKMYSDKYMGAPTEKVYFRQKPTSSTKPRVEGCESIAAGKQVTVLGECGSFYYITYKGYYGYVPKANIRVYGKVLPPTPTPKPTPDPTTAPIPSNISLTSEQQKKWNSVASNLIKAHDKNRDTRGWIYIPTTKNINYPIMYSSSFYYDDHTPEKKSTVRGSIYSYHDAFGGINTIAGHNSRESHTMFHELHHIQARLMGRKTCEGCGASVTYIDTNNLVFNIRYGAYSVWQLFAMYETGPKTNKDVLEYNTGYPNLSVKARRTWIDYQLSRSQKDFNVQVGDTEPLLVLVTCGDNYDSSTAQSRLYMFLKALY